MDDIDIIGAALDPQSAPLEPEIVEGPLPAFPSPAGFDLSPIALTLVPYERHVTLMVQEAKGIVVLDAASQKVAVSAEARNKKLLRDLETARKNFVTPYNDHVKKINNLFKTLTDPLASNEATIKAERGRYDLKVELERRRIEAVAREEQRQLQAKLDAEALAQKKEAEEKARVAAEKLKTEEDAATRAALEKEIAEEIAAANAPTPQVAPIVTEKAGVVRTTEGSSYTKFTWKCRVVDPDKVPRQYCEPVQKLLDEAAKGGVRKIDGCIIEEVAVPVTRV
jgi:hypothetical protein